MTSTMARALLVLTAVVGVRAADGADVSRYFESSANQRPRSNAGLAVRGDRVQLTADVAMRAPSGNTEIVPNLRSAFELGPHVGIETRVDLAEWNSNADLLAAKVDTRVRYRPPAPFFDELEGRVWKAPDGQSGRTLEIGFHQVLGANDGDRPITIRGKAMVEATSPGASASGVVVPAEDSRRFGLETEIRGWKARWAPGKSALRLKVERVAGAHVETAKSLAYDYSWTIRGFAQMGFNLGMRHATQRAIEVFEPSLGLTWRAQF